MHARGGFWSAAGHDSCRGPCSARAAPALVRCCPAHIANAPCPPLRSGACPKLRLGGVKFADASHVVSLHARRNDPLLILADRVVDLATRAVRNDQIQRSGAEKGAQGSVIIPRLE